MPLSNDLINQFVKVTKPNTESKKETVVYGTAVIKDDGSACVVLDGSDVETPVTKAVEFQNGDRVIVQIRNHTAVVTGNMTSPSVGTTVVKEMIQVDTAKIEELIADNATIKEKLSASEADISELEVDNVTIKEKMSAAEANIDNLKATKVDATYVDATYAKIAQLNATDAKVNTLEATYADFKSTTTETLEAAEADISKLKTESLTTESAKVIFATIDFSNIGQAAIEKFFATSGIIKDIVVGEGTITGELVGVTISGDLIKGNTIVAEKLVVKGEDGLYYKLNTDGVTTEAEQTDYNSLNGSVIKAKSITATKIAVDDLVAFDATIGGFNITEKALYSGAKSSVDNTTDGIYLDSDGQMSIGNSDSYLKYYKDSSGNYKLSISASDIYLSSGAVDDDLAVIIDDLWSADEFNRKAVSDMKIGGRNLAIASAANYASPGFNQPTNTIAGDNDYVLTDEMYNNTIVARWSGSSTTKWSGPHFGLTTKLRVELTVGEIYTLSAWMKADVETEVYYLNLAQGQSIRSYQTTVGTSWTRVFVTFIAQSANDNVCFYTSPNATTDAPYIYMCGIKLEKGNKPTDWTPAPEDMATAEEVTNAQNTADEANEKAANAQTLIAQLSDSISMLVTDGNGTSLMTQTEDGWTFSTSEIQSSVNAISEDLNSLTGEVGDVGSAVDILQQAVADLGVIAEYVKITVYEDEPCIELGEGDSDFKLRITNTRMMFTEGSTVLAYFTNQSFHSKNVVVEDELQQGGFVWKIRSNGNLALMWKGEND